jgi:hypothetical protein
VSGDIGEAIPAGELPAFRGADAGQRSLGEHDVRVRGGVPIAGPVADEYDYSTRRLVQPDTLSLAGAAHETRRVAEGE